MKNISILGSTGSIGTQTLDVVKNSKDKIRVVGLSAFSNIDKMEKQIHEFNPEIVSIYNKEDAEKLHSRIGGKIKILSGIEGLIEVATLNSADIVVTSVVGSIGLIPTLEAIKNKKTIALANKETLVVAGELIMKEAKKYGVKIIPVDSEHSAIFQCLQGENVDSISRLILTASGGSFRDWTKDQIKTAKVEDALKHPTWEMGKKITIDSATLMNKGLEVIEAKWLFNVDLDKIEVIVHPESIIHSMVEFKDTSIIAQMGKADMRVPIQYALNYPKRLKNNYKSLDFKTIGSLNFSAPDTEKFPCLKLAYEALSIGGTMPCVLNGANEVLVESFLQNKIGFYDIPKYIEKAMEIHKPVPYVSVEELLETDTWVRRWVENQLK